MELGTDKKIAEIISRLKLAKPGEGAVKVEGTLGSFARLLGAYISEKTSRPILNLIDSMSSHIIQIRQG